MASASAVVPILTGHVPPVFVMRLNGQTKRVSCVSVDNSGSALPLSIYPGQNAAQGTALVVPAGSVRTFAIGDGYSVVAASWGAVTPTTPGTVLFTWADFQLSGGSSESFVTIQSGVIDATISGPVEISSGTVNVNANSEFPSGAIPFGVSSNGGTTANPLVFNLGNLPPLGAGVYITGLFITGLSIQSVSWNLVPSNLNGVNYSGNPNGIGDCAQTFSPAALIGTVASHTTPVKLAITIANAGSVIGNPQIAGTVTGYYL